MGGKKHAPQERHVLCTDVRRQGRFVEVCLEPFLNTWHRSNGMEVYAHKCKPVQILRALLM